MSLYRWQNCTLDDTGSQALETFDDELHDLEVSFNGYAASLASLVADNTATTKTAATLIIPTSTGADGIRLTWIDGDIALPYSGKVLKGSQAHEFGIFISSVDLTGAGFLGEAFDYRSSTLRINPGFNASKVINTTTDTLIWVILSWWDNYFTAVNLVPGATIGSMERTGFSGANNAAITSTAAALDNVFSGTGVTWQGALNQLGIPTTSTTDTAEDVFQSISDYSILTTGTSLEKTGDNLTEIRALWALMGGSSAMATRLAEALNSAQAGEPLVQWTQSVTTTTTLSKCDGGTTQTVTTVSAYDLLNRKPSSTKNLTPTIWWIQQIAPTDANLKKLLSYGLSNAQISSALDETEANTHIITEANFLTTHAITLDEFSELLFYADIEGIASADFEDAMTSVTSNPASLNTGWISPAFSLPTQKLLEKISPAQSMSADIAAINDSGCIDPLNKAPLIAFVAAVNNMMSAVTRQIQQLSGIVRPALVAASGVISTAQKFLDDLEATTCVTGLNFATNNKLDLLVTEMELFAVDLKVTFKTVDTMLELILPPPCKIQNAIRDLLGPLYPDENCLIEGISDLAVNAYGRIQNLLPCINNPLSLLEVFNTLALKNGALASLVNGMLADLRRIQSQLNMISDIKSQDLTEETTSDCQSESLSVMVGRIKKIF